MTKLIHIVHHLSFSFIICASWVLCIVYGAESYENYPQKQAFFEPSIVAEDDVNAKLNSLVNVQVWLETKIGWRMIVGTIIGFFGAALGSAGGSGAGGIFIPMLTLVIGFDAKSSTAISKCMIMGLSGATVYYNIKQRHPTLDKPLIDYDLALLVQPMLLLGVSTGVTLNVVFAYWMVTILLIIVFLGTSTRSFFKGVELWKKETVMKKEAAQRMIPDQTEVDIEYRRLPGSPYAQTRVSLAENVNWKQMGVLILVWLAFLAIQIFKEFTTACSTAYWVLYLLQIPVAVGATFYQALSLNRRHSETANTTEGVPARYLTFRQLIFRSLVALLAGIIGGLLGLGGGFLLGPLFLEIGIIPQVSSATATFIMAFSASMCTIEYYLLNRLPLLYAAYFTSVAIIASLAGQYVVKKWIAIAGRVSLIVFILASIIFASALLLGGVGIADMIFKIEHNEYMGFEDLCTIVPSDARLPPRLLLFDA